MKNLRLSQIQFSRVFWEVIFSHSGDFAVQQERLASKLQSLERGRTDADYNTGSIGFATAWSLYSLTRYFCPSKIAEVGTFIGKSTISMAMALDDAGLTGREIFTCDYSNDIDLPWAGAARVTQYKRQSSADMFRTLFDIDFIFLDGRLNPEDFPLIKEKVKKNALIVLDDFEGVEKGVANVMNIRNSGVFNQCTLIYPPERAKLESIGLIGDAPVAVMLPAELIQLVPQG